MDYGENFSVGIAAFLLKYLMSNYIFSLCQSSILQQEQVSFHKKRHASALSAFLHNREIYMWLLKCLCWVAYQENKPMYLICPDSPTGILISSHFSCKPLTLLQNLVNSDVRISVSFQKLLCPLCTDVRSETRSGSNCIWKHFLAFVLTCTSDEQCLLPVQISSYTFWMTWNMC